MKELLARTRDVSADAFLITFGVAFLAAAVNTLAGGIELVESFAWALVATGLAAAGVAVIASTIRILAFDDVDDGAGGRLEDGEGSA